VGQHLAFLFSVRYCLTRTSLSRLGCSDLVLSFGESERPHPACCRLFAVPHRGPRAEGADPRVGPHVLRRLAASVRAQGSALSLGAPRAANKTEIAEEGKPAEAGQPVPRSHGVMVLCCVFATALLVRV